VSDPNAPDRQGYIAPQYFTFAAPPEELLLESGEKLGPITLAYETYGQLNREKDNAILILHALSGDAHAAGFHEGALKPGWWDGAIGPGKAFDTEKYFIICSNVLGGCKGSTGPASLNPLTQRPYGLDFPLITITDMVTAQKHLIDALGIDQLLAVAGGSMGGMQVLAWLATYPHRLKSAIPIATASKHSPQQIALNEVGRQAIMSDPNWNQGDYYDGNPPDRGLALARMIGHITYMSAFSMEEKFGRQRKNERQSFKFRPEFAVEGYLHYHGDNFIKRFDANTYLYITKAMDTFDMSAGKPLATVFKGISAKILVIAFDSDWLYPDYQSREIVKACKLAGLAATYCEVKSSYGHDAFLVEMAQQNHLISHFLSNVWHDHEGPDEYEI
jgi:homoserine O-acetyltransferase